MTNTNKSIQDKLATVAKAAVIISGYADALAEEYYKALLSIDDTDALEKAYHTAAANEINDTANRLESSVAEIADFINDTYDEIREDNANLILELDSLEKGLASDREIDEQKEKSEYTPEEQEIIDETMELIDDILKIQSREDIVIIRNLIKHLN